MVVATPRNPFQEFDRQVWLADTPPGVAGRQRAQPAGLAEPSVGAAIEVSR